MCDNVILLYMCLCSLYVCMLCVVLFMCVAVLCIAFYTYNTWYCVCNDDRIVLFEGVFMTTCTQHTHTQHNIHLHTCTIHVYAYTIHTHNTHLRAPHIHKCAHTRTHNTHTSRTAFTSSKSCPCLYGSQELTIST